MTLDLLALQVAESDRRGAESPDFYSRSEWRKGMSAPSDDVRTRERTPDGLPVLRCRCGARIDRIEPFTACQACRREAARVPCVRCGFTLTNLGVCADCARGKSRSRRLARRAPSWGAAVPRGSATRGRPL